MLTFGGLGMILFSIGRRVFIRGLGSFWGLWFVLGGSKEEWPETFVGIAFLMEVLEYMGIRSLNVAGV